MDQKFIRNFCIVAHIDHGKSTLADRLLELTGTIQEREKKEQILDSMDLEREKGITIKLTPVRMLYKKNNIEYELNLIDTPGHVDFSYEVSRSLKACDGAILIVDAAQGIEAQTIANVYLAIENDLEILPVINKIDLPQAEPEIVKKEIEEVIGISAEKAPLISAKDNINIQAVLDAIIDYLPEPKGDKEKPLKALIFDSYYDNYKGAVCLVRVYDGTLNNGDKIVMMATKKTYTVSEVGFFAPMPTESKQLSAGDVGYFCAAIKDIADTAPGDTVTHADNQTLEPLTGYKPIKPVVFCGVFPLDGSKYMELKVALEKLKLNDAALSYEQENSTALGFGFRCGFLGLLHMEIIEERLEREFDLDIITTAPSVVYNVVCCKGDIKKISNPSSFPKVQEINYIEEPVVKAHLFVPSEFIGKIMELCEEKRGKFIDIEYIDNKRVRINYYLPLNEIVFDFFDSLKSRTKGFASFDYEFFGYERSELVKLDVMLNGEVCDALAFIIHKDKAYARGKVLVEKLKEVIPRQMFEIPIQAAIGGKIIARETVKALRKDVLAKCYGGDITRKKKLLEKQKEGKKRMRRVGNVEIPSEAFISVLKMDK